MSDPIDSARDVNLRHELDRFSSVVKLFLPALAAAGLFCASLKLPLWHLKMEAPQYQGNEALRVHVFPGHMEGDLREIRVLNQYIGVHIPEHLPQLRWLPVALLAGAGLGLVAALLPRKQRGRGFFGAAALVTAALVVSAGLAQWQMHGIGHHRDAHTVLRGVQDFTPPLLGRVKIANFEITTSLGSGSGLIAVGLLLYGALAFTHLKRRPAGRRQTECAAEEPEHRLDTRLKSAEYSI